MWDEFQQCLRDADLTGYTSEEVAALRRFSPSSSHKRQLVTPLLVEICRTLMERLNSLTILNLEEFQRARAMGRPLLTFSNHVSLFDDPWLVATFAGKNWDEFRWCATDALNFFNTDRRAHFFSVGKGVPIVRGRGIEQPGICFMEKMLQRGDWVHIFPEGGRSRDPLHLATPLKKGMADLVQKARPILLPFHHRGMEQVLPIGQNFPSFGKQITLRFGSIHDSDTGLADQSATEIMDWAEAELLALEALQA